MSYSRRDRKSSLPGLSSPTGLDEALNFIKTDEEDGRKSPRPESTNRQRASIDSGSTATSNAILRKSPSIPEAMIPDEDMGMMWRSAGIGTEYYEPFGGSQMSSGSRKDNKEKDWSFGIFKRRASNDTQKSESNSIILKTLFLISLLIRRIK